MRELEAMILGMLVSAVYTQVVPNRRAALQVLVYWSAITRDWIWAEDANPLTLHRRPLGGLS